jgi:hypothetical protein
VAGFFQDEDGQRGIGFALPENFDPEGLRLPHLQELFARVIANWHLPFPERKRRGRKTK